MSATTWFRIAAVLFVLFTAGHTFGFLNFKAPSAEGRAVFDGMNTVTMQVRGATFTYGGFYKGFGLTITLYLILSAYLAWHLGTLAATNPAAIGALAWVFTAVQAGLLVLSWVYFFMPTVILSALAVISLGAGAWLVR
jgi:hypothetical protein